jgi:hypothetical protein
LKHLQVLHAAQIATSLATPAINIDTLCEVSQWLETTIFFS